MERHRLLTVLTHGIGTALRGGRILEIAPNAFTTGLLRRLEPRQLVSADFDPGADGRSVDVQASLTQLPFAAGSFDFLLCLHVLEHIPDDRSAMAEIARVLAPSGVALLQVPWTASKPTDDPDGPVSKAERIARFGRADHVRQYGGSTLDDRLRAAGLQVDRFASSELFGPQVMATLGLMPAEMSWLVRPAPSAPADGVAAGDGAPAADRADGADRPPLRELLVRWLTPAVGATGDRLPDLLPPLITASERLAQTGRELRDLQGSVAGLRTVAERADALQRRVEHLQTETEHLQTKGEHDRSQSATELAAARSAEQAAQRSAVLWERRYTTLRGRLPIRVAARVGVPVKAAIAAARSAARAQRSGR